MELRIIKPKRRTSNDNKLEEIFVIGVNVLGFDFSNTNDIIPIRFERVDFKTGELKKTIGITYPGTIRIFNDSNKRPPFNTDCIVYKENGKIKYKIIGAYNTGFLEKWYSVENKNLDNDESQIISVFNSHFKEINEWIGDLDANQYDY